MLDELLDLVRANKRDIFLILAAAVVTFLCTKLLPYALTVLNRLFLFHLSCVTGRRADLSFENKYLRWLANDTKYLSTVPTEVVDPAALPARVVLEDVFIRLQLRMGDQSSVDMPTSQLFTPGARTIVLGDPGAGKTTLLRYAWAFNSLLDLADHLERKTNGWPVASLRILDALILSTHIEFGRRAA